MLCVVYSAKQSNSYNRYCEDVVGSEYVEWLLESLHVKRTSNQEVVDCGMLVHMSLKSVAVKKLACSLRNGNIMCYLFFIATQVITIPLLNCKGKGSSGGCPKPDVTCGGFLNNCYIVMV
jgi:hypothetical protein